MSAATWHRFEDVDIPEEGRVRAAVVDGRPVAPSPCSGRLGALENSCPHQGRPLGEGSIEKGLLRCPWHGYDNDPLTGVPPGDFAVAISTATLQAGSDHGELVARAVKHAIDGRGVAHLVIPDEMQVLPSDAKAVGPQGRLADHPLAAGVLGRSGTPVASWLMNESDLVLVVGTARCARH